MYYLLNSSTEGEEPKVAHAMDNQLCMAIALKGERPEPVPHLRFSISQAGAWVDYINIINVVGGVLCSQRFIDVLTSQQVPFFAYPAELLDERSRQPLSAQYSFWFPVTVEDAIDWERSESFFNQELGSHRLTKLVLKNTDETAFPPLFNAKWTANDLVDEHLRTQMLEAGLTGVAFVPLDGVHIPHLGSKKMELEQQLERHPTDAELWCELSDVLERLQRLPEALAAIESAIALSPDLEKAWYARGVLLYKLKNMQEALVALERTLRINPQSQAWEAYAVVFRDMGRLDEALAAAQRLVQCWPKDGNTWHVLGTVHLALGQDEAALDAFERSIERGGGLRIEITLQKRAEALERLKRYEEALETYEYGLMLRPLNFALKVGKAKALRALGRATEAELAEQVVQEEKLLREKHMKQRPM